MRAAHKWCSLEGNIGLTLPSQLGELWEKGLARSYLDLSRCSLGGQPVSCFLWVDEEPLVDSWKSLFYNAIEVELNSLFPLFRLVHFNLCLSVSSFAVSP